MHRGTGIILNVRGEESWPPARARQDSVSVWRGSVNPAVSRTAAAMMRTLYI